MRATNAAHRSAGGTSCGGAPRRRRCASAACSANVSAASFALFTMMESRRSWIVMDCPGRSPTLLGSIEAASGLATARSSSR